MNQRLFLAIIIGISVSVFLIFNAFLSSIDEITMVATACGISLFHVLSGFYMSRWAFTKSSKLFVSIVMGGMGIRMTMMAILLVLLIQWVHFDVKLFMFTFGIYYVLFQIVEVYFINRGFQLKKAAK